MTAHVRHGYTRSNDAAAATVLLTHTTGLFQGVTCVLVPCPFAVRRPTTKRDSTSRSSTACTGLSGDYAPVRSDGGRLCSKACLATSYTACRFKTETEATHRAVGNKVGKWSVHGAKNMSRKDGTAREPLPGAPHLFLALSLRWPQSMGLRKQVPPPPPPP